MTTTAVDCPAVVTPRLLGGTPSIGDHLDRYGPLPACGPSLVDEVARAGLGGRGGADFALARKLAAVGAGRRTVVVANGAESEPLSAKDKTLLCDAPHLVLDGLAAAAGAVGATRAILCIEAGTPDVRHRVNEARSQRHDRVAVELVETPPTYVAGQGTALVSFIDGGPARPTGRAPRHRGVGGRPTLVSNVETLADLALVARYGADWYRQVGPAQDPGTRLVTVRGAVDRPGVYEIVCGHPLDALLTQAGVRTVRAVLVGGYAGRWLDATTSAGLRLDRESCAAAGVGVGSGVILVADDDVCVVDEVARVAGWYAANSARQCGPCQWGLADIATTIGSLQGHETGADDLRRWATMISGRGACHFPDGAAGFVASALDVFATEVAEHQAGTCRRPRSPWAVPPSRGSWR